MGDRTLPKPPKGWHWFGVEYELPERGRWIAHVLAQSEEDAETRVRCIGENGVVTGRLVAEVPWDEEGRKRG